MRGLREETEKERPVRCEPCQRLFEKQSQRAGVQVTGADDMEISGDLKKDDVGGVGEA